ncbi:MAG: hypothetical protein ACREFY_07345, partial [Acetobacteraceae bacterium]
MSQKLWLRDCGVVVLLGCQDGIPGSGRTSILKTQPPEVELPLADTQQQLDPRCEWGAETNAAFRSVVSTAKANGTPCSMRSARRSP